MTWIDEAVRQLLAHPVCGYRRESLPAVEPTALAALAILATGHGGQAAAALDWLLAAQSGDGSLGIDARTRRPCWPTGWAIVAWNSAAKKAPAPKAEWSAAAGRAADWLLSRERPADRSVDHHRGRLPAVWSRHDAAGMAVGRRHALLGRADGDQSSGLAECGAGRPPAQPRGREVAPRPPTARGRLELRQHHGSRAPVEAPGAAHRPGAGRAGGRSGDPAQGAAVARFALSLALACAPPPPRSATP